MSQAILDATAARLRTVDAARYDTLIGLDGFVDNIIDVVDKRTDARNYTRVDTITQMADRIRGAAGLSSNVELVIRQMKLGGNGPIMANALIQSGCGVTYIGSIGREGLHPVFSDMALRCKAAYGLCDPGHTDALEFRDGKLMFGKHQTLKEVNYERMLEVVGLEKMRAAWGRANLVALTNWTMLPLQTEIWRRLLADMAGVKTPPGAILFVDLADPEKRPPGEIADAVRLLKGFRKSHRVVLGVNQKESMEVSRAIGLQFDQDYIESNAAKLRTSLELDVVVIHPTKNAAVATEKGSALLEGPYCANPKLTTGAGDNFNAGFCLGLLAGLEPSELLACGTGTSGYYVRNGRSPTQKELAAFLELWSKRFGDAAF